MKISMQKTTWMSVSFAFALLAGSPAIADDTELLLLNPDPAQNPKPNVMFILDTSGSMTTTQTTIEPYDSDEDYGGDCNSDAMYWTDVDVLPVCDGMGTNTQWFWKAGYRCEFSELQIAGIGSFTDTMVMFRPNSSGTKYSWQDIVPGVNTALVECQADSTTTEQWPRRGSALSVLNPWTDDESQQASWGSPPRNISYTVYDGNYLNWKNSPEEVTLSRSDIMKAVTNKVLASVNNLNVGLMRFDGGDGGPVILDITDLDDNRQTVLDAVDALPAGGVTPLAETLYESALFWRGQPALYGAPAFTTLTDPNALLTTDPPVYEQPDWDACAKNYNVLLTDGAPVSDNDVHEDNLMANLANSADVLGYTGCDGAGGGRCLDDIAQYLSLEDIDGDEDGDQFVTTHTIGFTIDLDILEETADDSGGQYFLANDVESLTKTLLSIIADINDRSLSFSAPAVSVNTFNRTQNLNDLYITTFGAKARARWPGNLKKYRIDIDTIVDQFGNPAVNEETGFFDKDARSFWTTDGNDGNDVRKGGAANQLPDPSERNLYTNNGNANLYDATNHISPDNEDAFLDAEFGLSGADGEPEKEEIIRWARGEDLLDEDNNTGTDVRNAMGDPLHSQPAAIVYGGDVEDPEVVVYTATNDGYLHAFDGDTGVELWAFIPKELLDNLTRLYFDPRSKYKQYGLDGNVRPIVKDVDDDGQIESDDGDFVYIIFGMRRGGDTYYALDVTDKTKPKLLWDVSLPEAGESWSTPVVARVEIDGVTQNDDNAVVVLGGGYDTAHDNSPHPTDPDGSGAGIHFLDLESGVEVWRAGIDNTADLTLDTLGREMDRAIPNQVRVIDLNGDRLADRMYASDLGGQIWRFDIYNGEDRADLVKGGVIAQLGAEGAGTVTEANTRRFYNAPDVSLITDDTQQRRYISVSIGSGYRARPFDQTAEDRFYSVRDPNVFTRLDQTAYDSYDIITDDDLVEVSGSTQTVITSSDGGWKFTLPENEKVLADSLTFADQVFFVTFSPESDAQLTCEAGKGTNFLYRVSAINGDPLVANIAALDPLDSDGERRESLRQGGIAPSPTILFPSPDPDCEGDECLPIQPLGCVGVECFDPGFENNPVRTLWTQDGIE